LSFSCGRYRRRTWRVIQNLIRTLDHSGVLGSAEVRVFVIMPFREGVRRVLSEHTWGGGEARRQVHRCYRLDEIRRAGRIDEDQCMKFAERTCVLPTSPKNNPNVLWEGRYSMGARSPAGSSDNKESPSFV